MGTQDGNTAWNDIADVVVVGGGGAGMAGALSAAETAPEADILLIQKLDELGGSTTISMGSFSAAETSLQAEHGITDSPASHFHDLDKFVRSHAKGAGTYFYIDFAGDLTQKDNLKLRSVLVEEGATTLEWLEGHGCEYAGPYSEPGHSVPRVYQIVPDTTAYATELGERLVERNVRIWYQSVATALIKEAGEVTGVRVRRNNETDTLSVKAENGVILATGDYINNQELRATYTSNATAPAINQHNTGDGHEMAKAAGAKLVNMDIQEFFMRLGDPLYTNPEFPSMVAAGAILVNANGDRFVNEIADYDQVFTAALNQPSQEVYIVFDDAVAQQFTEWPNHISTYGKHGKVWAYLDEYLATDALARSSSVASLADTVGFSPESFEETMQTFRTGVEVDGVRMDKFGRAQHRHPLDTPPYYALGPVRPYSVITDGGIAVTPHMQALDTEGSPIDGLYVAGSAAGDVLLFGHGHHHSWTFTTGRLAGNAVVSSD